MESLALNSTVLSPRGFRPTVTGAPAAVGVAPRRLWGATDIAALRDAALVGVDVEADSDEVDPARDDVGSDPGPTDRLVLTATVALALAGVPVTGDGLPEGVRGRLDAELLATMDAIHPDSVRDPGDRELLSLALRRRAWQVAGYRPRTEQPPTVLVLLPDCEVPQTLRRDLEAQVHPGLQVRQVQVAEGPEAEAAVREGQATYVTRMVPGLRYGPHHLADLVHALGHSGARVALSPRRFLPWRGGAWLEDWRGPSESPAEEGLPGGSLWYAVDGATEPVPAGEGYAVHGTGAVEVLSFEAGTAKVEAEAGSLETGSVEDTAERAGLTPLRLHRSLPRVLAWHGHQFSEWFRSPDSPFPSGFADGPVRQEAQLAPVEPSYFAGAG